MPYRSVAQERWAHTPEGQKALGGPQAVAEWDAASKGIKLPNRVKPKPAGYAPGLGKIAK
ncbi:MAG TPA: hypothetical protein VFL96_02005, partial [Acidobacteriaceae bacterium]|nr:hypothetical protein [Acidobacteriaceae bacterium]